MKMLILVYKLKTSGRSWNVDQSGLLAWHCESLYQWSAFAAFQEFHLLHLSLTMFRSAQAWPNFFTYNSSIKHMPVWEILLHLGHINHQYWLKCLCWGVGILIYLIFTHRWGVFLTRSNTLFWCGNSIFISWCPVDFFVVCTVFHEQYGILHFC